MSQQRPKRKAAVNKTYVDTASESLFDSMVASSSKSSSSSGSSSGKSTQNSSRSPKKKQPNFYGRAPSETPAAVSNGHRACAAPYNSSAPVPYNWQPPLSHSEDFSHKLDLTDATVNTVLQTLTCPQHAANTGVQREEHELRHLQHLLVKNSGIEPEPLGPRRKQPRQFFQIKKGDYIYMVSEPPGEPYYIGRVKGFKRKDETYEEKEVESASHYMFQIQWFYRPRDISKHTSDSRLLFASMHSDSCPLNSFRGLLTVLHKSDVETYFQPPKGSPQWGSALEFYASFPNCFYFDKLYDRYILKFFDVVKTSTLLSYIDNTANCSRHYILALNKRFEFVSMEGTRTKVFLNNFTSKMSTHCDVCAEWCGSSDSVTCAGCEKHFHMFCLDPPLMRKPSRGFSWSCAVCTKKHEMEYQSRKMLMLSHDNRSTNEEEIAVADVPLEVAAQDAVERKTPDNVLPKYEQMAIEYLNRDAHVSVLERRLREEWNIRYLGSHARLEEAVDLFDKSYYPRASTSLGQRYQVSNIPECEGHPIVYYDPDKSVAEKKKKPNGKKPAKKKGDADSLKELPVPKEYEGVNPKDFPQWLQPRPKGYIERGVDDGVGETCTLMWKSSESDIEDNFQKLDDYVGRQNPMAVKLGLHPNSPNFVDAVVKAYLDTNGDTQKASEIVSRLTRASLKEPTFTKEEVRRFEAGVKKHGSELYPVSKEVKTQTTAMTVRFYYVWKKTPRGHMIWGNFPGRKKKPSKDADMKIKPVVDDYADSDDDSAYENDKIVARKKPFQCKHCKSYRSQKWFKITGFDGTTTLDDTEVDDVDPNCVIALCFRCAKIWRRYAVYWEDPLEVDKKNARGVGGYKRKVEAELVADAERILLHARNEGVALSYDFHRDLPQSSVIEGIRWPRVNGTPKQPSVPEPKEIEEATPPPKAAPKSSGSRATKTRKPASAASEPEETKVPESSKRPAKPVTERSSKKRKDTRATPEAVKAERPKKRPAPARAETSKKQKKPTPEIKQRETAVKKEPAAVKPEKIEVKSDLKSAPRRQRKNADATVLVNPIFNSNYKNQPEEILALLKTDKKALPPLTPQTLEQVLDASKARQLLDVKSLVNGWQAPQQAKIDLPFSVNDRNCSVCLEHDSSDSSSQEVLICSNCGVNVHGSCAGIGISGKVKPVRQWLCEPCVNDMGPKFSTNYSCSICLAKSPTTELAILGSPSEKPDYLVPIIESGRWCHMICALYCHEQISFRNVQAPNFVPKEVMASTSTKSLGCMVESVSKLFVDNFDKKCGICKCFNGGLISCDLCQNESVYHVTCAQDTPNFKLGFKVVPQKISKSHTNTIVRDQVGKLEPILVCPQHEQKGFVLDIRDQGKRTSTGESKPLIQLFIEDLMRNGPRLSGPQLQAHNYISMIATYMEKTDIGKKNGPTEERSTRTECHFCRISSSPKWWPLEAESSEQEQTENAEKKSEKDVSESEKILPVPAKPIAHVCQKCHVLGPDREPEDAQAEGDNFMSELSKPLSGEHYGVKGMNDHIDYTPFESKVAAVERSEITWGDLLG